MQNELPAVQVRGARPALARAGDERGPELVDVGPGHLARVLRHPQLAGGVGAPITDSDVEGGTKVCVLGQTVVDKLFGASSDPVGQMVRIKNIPFQVVGVLARKGQSPMGQDYDDAVFVPYTTFGSKIQGGLQELHRRHADHRRDRRRADTARAETQITDLLRDRHHIAGRATTTSRSAT